MTDLTTPAAKPVKLSKNIAAKLATLNSLRAANGKPALATWKNAEALLDQRIQEETPTTVTYQPQQGPDMKAIEQAMHEAAVTSDVPVTKLPASSELRTGAKRKAIIEQIAATSVAADVPTTVIDAKAASRKLRATEAKAAPKAAPKAKAAKAKAPKSTNEFGALLAELGLDAKKARAKLRSNGMSAPYTDLKAIRQVLTTDGRKKAK